MSRLLCVDDSEEIRTVYKRMLRNHELVLLENPSDAIKLLEMDSAFDRIICDWEMGPYCGKELYNWVKVNKPELMNRFVFVTGSKRDVEKVFGDEAKIIEKANIMTLRVYCQPAA